MELRLHPGAAGLVRLAARPSLTLLQEQPTVRSVMDALVEQLDAGLQHWQPDTSRHVRALVKEIARLGGDVRDFVPGNVRVALRKRLKSKLNLP